ncbi:unnamed protein product, partial [Prorocentrum cordatum]
FHNLNSQAEQPLTRASAIRKLVRGDASLRGYMTTSPIRLAHENSCGRATWIPRAPTTQTRLETTGRRGRPGRRGAGASSQDRPLTVTASLNLTEEEGGEGVRQGGGGGGGGGAAWANAAAAAASWVPAVPCRAVPLRQRPPGELPGRPLGAQMCTFSYSAFDTGRKGGRSGSRPLRSATNLRQCVPCGGETTPAQSRRQKQPGST